jgi:hypothetical protein
MEMPIARAMAAILHDGASPLEKMKELMLLPLTLED